MTSMPSMVEVLAAEAAAQTADDLPRPVLEKARLCLMDYFSSAYEARALPWSRQAAANLTPVAEGAPSLAAGMRVAPAEAAFSNAVAAHGLVREDMHTGSVAHLGIVVWPALLAALAMPDTQASGRDLLAAAVIGYQAGARLGRHLMSAELARLFRPTGLVGPFAAASAVAHLRGFSPQQTATAMSLAINCAAGLNQWPVSGGSDMYFHAGFAARNGLQCADLAKAGAFASPDVIEGEAGLFAAFARRPLKERFTLLSDGGYEILSVFHKQAPACNFTQTPSQAALAARRKLGAQSTGIVGIKVGVTRAAMLYPGCDAVGPFDNVLQAKMSIQFGVAAAIARERIDNANYDALDDPRIAQLSAIITLVEDSDFSAAYPARQPASVRLDLADGTSVAAALDDVIAADETMVAQRFLASVRTALGTGGARDLQAFIELLADIDDASPLNALQTLRPNLN